MGRCLVNTILYSVRLATIRALEAAAEFIAGPAAVALRKRAREAPLVEAQREVAALRLALGSLVWVARGKANMAKSAEEDLLSLGIEMPLRELAGRIEASFRVNPTRRSAIAARDLAKEIAATGTRGDEPTLDSMTDTELLLAFKAEQS